MEKIPFIIKELSIRKMPGLEQGLSLRKIPGPDNRVKQDKGFSPNINIIAGPNASGKSSTARMIRQIISRDDTSRIQADSTIHINQEPWYINIDSRQVTVQRNGIDDQLTGLPPAEAQDRYMLAFHELVNQEEKDLARAIVRESIGGYDLDRARRELNYSEGIASRKVGAYQEYDDAHKDYKKIHDRQHELKEEEERLEKLRRQEQQAREASQLKEFYQLVRDWLAQKKQYEEIKARYEAYPAVIGRLNGEEHNNIQQLENEISGLRQSIQSATDAIGDRQQELDKLKLPGEGISDEVLDDLDAKIRQLEETERTIHERQEEIRSARAKEQEALQAIGKSLDPEAWEGINLDDTAGLQKFLEQASSTYAEKQFMETEIRKLQENPEREEEGDAGNLREGIQHLSLWLREQTGSGIAAKWLWWLAAAGIITAAATWLLGPYGLIGIAAIVVLTLLALKKPSAEQSHTRVEDYRRTGLAEPESWEPGPVADKMDQLAEKLSAVRYRDKINQKIEQLQEQLKDLQPEIDGIKKRHAGWLEQLKGVPNLPEENVRNYKGLYWFLVHVQKWQVEHAEAKGLSEQAKELKERHARILEKINQHLRNHEAADATDAASARATWKRLKDEEAIRRKNTDDINRQKKSIEDYNGQLEAKDKTLKQIYNKLGLEQGMKQRVKELTDRLEEYRTVEEQYNEQLNRLNVKKESMEEHPLFSDHRDEVETLTPERVEDMIGQYDQQASRLEKTRDEIARINERIESTSKGDDLEQALSRKDQALDKLEDLYRHNLSSLTGHILVEELKQESQQENQTPVFKRANQLFQRITRGRYELRLEENDDTVFKAFDTVKNRGQYLEELSTGTRIQLLLAVRLAFIETQESTLKLPVLADELLANSDDDRARAIIDALVEISRDGRQVFYFTAQGDEVAKWRHHLDQENPLDYGVFGIKGENSHAQDYMNMKPDWQNMELINQVPAPNGKSHEQYGRELGVPAFNPLTHTVEQLHLWYLTEDTRLLYNCLSMGIARWGQLKNFTESNGRIEGLDESTLDHIRQKAAVAEHFRELYRQGRPVPLTREVLEASGAVSDNFMEAVVKKMKELNYMPDKLVQALKNKQVPRFLENKADELEKYLYDQGYLKAEKPLGRDDLRVRINAVLSRMNLDGNEAERLIERLLQSR